MAFSDHFAHIVTVKLPDNMGHSISPRSRPFFKVSSEIVMDDVFRAWLQREMIGWLEVKQRGLAVLSWCEIIVKPGIRRLAITRSKGLKKIKRSRLNCMLMKQSFFTRELQAGNWEHLWQLRQVQADLQNWYENESRKVGVNDAKSEPLRKQECGREDCLCCSTGNPRGCENNCWLHG